MSAKIQFPYTLFLVSCVLVICMGLSAFVIFGNGQQVVSFLDPGAARYILVGSGLVYVLVDIRIFSSILEQKRQIKASQQD